MQLWNEIDQRRMLRQLKLEVLSGFRNECTLKIFCSDCIIVKDCSLTHFPKVENDEP